jgi:superfamily II DNA/RNA helicase
MIYGPRSRTIGDLIFEDIGENEYLRSLYNKLLKKYSRKIFDRTIEPFGKKELSDLLSFADILSKSTDGINSDIHKVWGQQIVALLSKLYPNDPEVAFYKDLVLTSCNNYEGLAMSKGTYKAISQIDKAVELSEKTYYSIPGHPGYFFFPDQKSIFNGLSHECFSFSAPTSLGKSFVMRIFIRQEIAKGATCNFAIIVPTKALINETRSKVIEELDSLLDEKNYRVVVSASDLMLEQDHHYILIMTPERFIYLINTRETKADYLFIDEAHKISSIDKRSAFYYMLVDKMSKQSPKPHIVFASPNIPNPEEYLKLIPNGNEKRKERTSFSPVSQIKFLINLDSGETDVYDDYQRTFTKIGNSSKKSLPQLISQLAAPDDQNIIYCSTVNDTIDLAEEYGDNDEHTVSSMSKENKAELEKLSNEIKVEISSEYFLVDLIKKGIAYHIGYLPSNIRLKIENGFKNGVIKTLFCTSTLIEGVNLPADNLFITSYKNGRKNLTDVEFRNLIGRVGRIDHSLFGNVFMVGIQKKEEKSIETFQNLIKKDIPPQSLSLNNKDAVSDKQKAAVAKALFDEDYTISSKPSKTTDEQFNLMRKLQLIAISDIQNGNEGIVTKELKKYIRPEDMPSISQTYRDRPAQQGMDTSYDQQRKLKIAIRDGLSYPTLVGDKTDYESIRAFLEKLADIFNWRTYEKKTLGHCKSGTNILSLLGQYSVILEKWMSGKGLNIIIVSALAYRAQHPYIGIWANNYKFIDVYEPNNKKHKNYIIAETLSIIENVILFSIANYFREFSSEYKTSHGITGFMRNDWYEFVEFGTTNEKTIVLQRIGYSRESASFIKERGNYFFGPKTSNEYSFSLKKDLLLSCSDLGVSTETKDILLNVPDIFQ